ncbi:zinc finger BED domain-containing protein RICESLEEPER 2-like isoform X1 [Papaver somniferum]|uniref:zinc finger BED domain-containing protein RICESLEEPER 2-like isoform X1 n=1 Tax=Papaver somniferum TaxID=3469 RepID=UPI000E6F8398|nr:zinc finger BED domain-containing protein RICESLEEPER 2-like isoform X1 [Papaver somniferum]
MEANLSPTQTRKRNLKSVVWKDFDLIEENGKEKAKCKHCGMKYSYDCKKGGTSTLQRHVRKCHRSESNQNGLLLLSQLGERDFINDSEDKVVDMDEEEEEEDKIEEDPSFEYKRKRNRKSSVWSEYDLVKRDGKQKAKCRHCGIEYLHDSKRSGTSTLQRHVRKCLKLGPDEMSKGAVAANTDSPIPPRANVGQLLLPQVSWNGDTSTPCAEKVNHVEKVTRVEKINHVEKVNCVEKVNHDIFREKIAMSIVKHNYPLDIVEHEGFRDICSYLNANVKHISRDTAQEDIFQLHKKQKVLIFKRLSPSPGNVCLTLDLWKSGTTDGYICLAVHFIDPDWVLQKLVLNFLHLQTQQEDHVTASMVVSVLGEWGIEEKIFSITSNNSDVTCVKALMDQLYLKGVLHNARSCFHVPCCAHILNLMVQEGLRTVNVAVEKVRGSVKYLKASEVTNALFLHTAMKLDLTPTRDLCLDVPTRWSSTSNMLDSCIAYQKVFEHLKLIDENYQDCPTSEEWEQIAAVSKLLKAFYDVTNMFAGSKRPTANVYFQGIWKIQMILKKEHSSSNEIVRLMADRMQIQFVKFWTVISPILAIAVVMDPRRKLSFVDFCYQKLYPETYILEVKKVRDKMDSLYRQYSSCKSTEITSSAAANMGSVAEANSTFDVDEIGEDLQEFASFQSLDRLSQMSELDFYIVEPPLPLNHDLDILHFWKSQEYRYPNLSRMARDILTIPISTVASESAYNSEGRVLDQHCSSLTPEIAEALVTTRDWLYGVSL